MLHPSYTELLAKINKDNEENDIPSVDSRYSLVIATAKRAREIIGGDERKAPYVPYKEDEKPLSIAVKELYDAKIVILPESEEDEEIDFIETEDEDTSDEE